MSQKGGFRYAEADGVQLLALPDAGEDLSMLVLLPKEVEGLAELEQKLTAESLAKWTEDLRQREVQVFLPRFKLTSQFRLAEVLAPMGNEAGVRAGSRLLRHVAIGRAADLGSRP